MAQGAIEGDPPRYTASSGRPRGWQLGSPDLIVTMTEPFVLPAAGADVFRTFVIPIPRRRRATSAPWNSPGTRVRCTMRISASIAHVVAAAGSAGPAARIFGRHGSEAAYPPGYMLGWTPGQRPRPSPEGMPWRLERESDLVVQLHMQPTGKPEAGSGQRGVVLHRCQRRRERRSGFGSGSETIDIAAGESQLCRQRQLRACRWTRSSSRSSRTRTISRDGWRRWRRCPTGRRRPLISIADWDFRWQDVYRYARPIALPKGTTIRCGMSTTIPRRTPAIRIGRPGESSGVRTRSDEMGDLWLQLVPRSNGRFRHAERRRQPQAARGGSRRVREARARRSPESAASRRAGDAASAGRPRGGGRRRS